MSTVRFATESDLTALAALVQLGFSHQWTAEDAKSWLVAEIDGRLVGAVQVCMTRPVGRLELLSVVDDLDHRTRAAVVKTLTAAGLTTLQHLGCPIAACFVAQHDRGFRRMLKKRLGAQVVNAGVILSVPLGNP